jgi:hypothetical protein
MYFPSQLLQDDTVSAARAILAGSLSQMLLASLCKTEERMEIAAVFYTPRGSGVRIRGESVLLNGVDIDHDNGTEAHIVRKPE